MNLPLPNVFNPALSSDRLQLISQWLLEELYATEDDLSRLTDNTYTRGCTTFGRQKNRILVEHISGKHKWLSISNTSNDLVFAIGGVPCRFSNDDPSNPSKDAVLTANRFQLDFLEFATNDQPGRFCFVIDRGHTGSAEPRVEFLGFSFIGELVCRWVSDSVRVLRLESAVPLTPAVEVAKPHVAPKRRSEGDTGSEAV